MADDFSDIELCPVTEAEFEAVKSIIAIVDRERKSTGLHLEFLWTLLFQHGPFKADEMADRVWRAQAEWDL